MNPTSSAKNLIRTFQEARQKKSWYAKVREYRRFVEVKYESEDYLVTTAAALSTGWMSINMTSMPIIFLLLINTMTRSSAPTAYSLRTSPKNSTHPANTTSANFFASPK